MCAKDADTQAESQARGHAGEDPHTKEKSSTMGQGGWAWGAEAPPQHQSRVPCYRHKTAKTGLGSDSFVQPLFFFPLKYSQVTKLPLGIKLRIKTSIK